MKAFRNSLRYVLTIPYVILTLALAGTIAALSYNAGDRAVSALSSKLLEDMSLRIGQAIELHLVGSRVALEAVAPDGDTFATRSPGTLESLKSRLWTATSLHPDPNNYVYFGSAEGQFVGVFRHQNRVSELRIKHSAAEPRKLYEFSHPDSPARLVSIENTIYDPRERPWFKAAVAARGPIWTPVYVDYRTRELVTTRARPVFDANGGIAGILGTDVSLQQLNDFLGTLKVSLNGVAFIVEQDGHLIAISDREATIGATDSDRRRVLASDAANGLVRDAYRHFRELVASGQSLEKVRTASFNGETGPALAAINAITDDIGLKWVSIVAVPRGDVMGDIGDSLARSAIIGLVAALVAVGMGLWVVDWVARDLRKLSNAARRIGDGALAAPVAIRRSDEIGQLARTFENMQHSLQTDRLTGIANREAFVRHLSQAIAARGEACCVAVLFIDLDRFKAVNDRFGHDAGDRVLCEVAGRIRSALRATDVVARFGGDEFVVLLRDMPDAEVAASIRDKLRELVGKPLASLAAVDPEATVGSSVGMAIYPGDGDEPETLIKHADHRMIRAKGESR